MLRRVLYIIDSLSYTGPARQLMLLAEGLADCGLDVHIAALGDAGASVARHWIRELAAAKVPVTQLGRRWPIDPISAMRLAKLITRLRPDIIHTWNADAGIYPALAARRLGIPRIVVGLHRIQPWTADWEWFMKRRIAAHIDRFVTSSPAVHDWFITKGLPAEKFVVIPSGVPTARPSDLSRDELIRELHLPADAKLIGVVGRLVPSKRVKDLIWAADLLRVLHDNLRMLIIGNGPLLSQLERYARLASDLDHIRFLGERHDVWRIMPHLDVLWNGSENIGPSTAILEAMAAGVPVVASDTPTNRELVVDDETGYLIPLGSRAGRAARARHTDRIFNESTLAAKLGASSKERAAEHFNARQMVQLYSDLD